MLSTCGRIIRHAVLAVAHVIPYASPVLASIPLTRPIRKMEKAVSADGPGPAV